MFLILSYVVLYIKTGLMQILFKFFSGSGSGIGNKSGRGSGRVVYV